MLDVLTGAINPSGKLTQNWVRNVGAVRGPESPYIQIRGGELLYNDADNSLQSCNLPSLSTAHLHKGTSGYWDEPSSPLFTFGHGLSYSSFQVTNASVSPSPAHRTFTAGESFVISGSIASSGPAGRLTLFAFFSQVRAPGCL